MLTKLSYWDFEGEAHEWQLQEIDFAEQNLVVGRNATGKSRLINVTSALLSVLAGTRKIDTLNSGRYLAEFSIEGSHFLYELAVQGQTSVKFERLVVNDLQRLVRDNSGKGRIYFEAEARELNFEIEESAIAFQAKRDRLQHSFIVKLSDWALNSTVFGFGRPTKNQLVMGTALTTESPDTDAAKYDPHNVLQTYVNAYKTFGAPFDTALVEDMQAIGFAVTEVNAGILDSQFMSPSPNAPVLTLSVRERAVASEVNQLGMSDGMFRSLALAINLNWLIFTSRRGLFLVDDLGEGLDYERACKAIELTMRKARKHGIQIVVTSNDRFVMNTVPLESWILLSREGGKVQARTARNSPELFENFEYTGLSNFDFFTSNSVVH